MKKEDFACDFVPSAPPSYEAVDVVEEFSKRFERRKDCIRIGFQKKRVALESQYQKQLDCLNKEENSSLAQLHTSYVQWVNVEPPESISNQTFFTSPQGGTSKNTSSHATVFSSVWRWVPW